MRKDQIPGAKIFERYEVLSTIGRGGMGNVFKVYDEVTSEIKALKILIAEGSDHERKVQRFKKEFSVMRELAHPHIIQAYDFHDDTKAGVAFSMEYVEGQDLDSIIYREDSYMSLENRIGILEQIAEALWYAHRQDIIHRDLKPANVLIREEPGTGATAKLTDFGLAQEGTEGIDLTKSSNQIGTAYYMSPEQYRGEILGVHTDIYSYGILAYELCTGRKPFDGETPFSLFLAHVAQGIPEPKHINPEIPSWLSTLIEICAEKEKKHRYQSMEEVLLLLQSKKSGEKRGVFSRFFR
jgi:eukaryotic-like serine/threonine-protein kinase